MKQLACRNISSPLIITWEWFNQVSKGYSMDSNFFKWVLNSNIFRLGKSSDLMWTVIDMQSQFYDIIKPLFQHFLKEIAVHSLDNSFVLQTTFSCNLSVALSSISIFVNMLYDNFKPITSQHSDVTCLYHLTTLHYFFRSQVFVYISPKHCFSFSFQVFLV